MHELADLDSEGINIDPDVKSSSVHAVKPRKFKPTQVKKCKQQAQAPSFCRNGRNCGQTHGYRECPAYGKQCSKCSKYNHFPSVCRSAMTSHGSSQPRQQGAHGFQPRQQGAHGFQQRQQPRRQQYGQLHELDCNPDEAYEVPDDMFQNFVIESVDVPNSKNEIHVTAEVLDKSLELKIDSGAKCNVISLATLKALNIRFQIDTSQKASLISYSNNVMTTLGIGELNCKVSSKSVSLRFHVVDAKAKTILGLPDALRLQLLSYQLSFLMLYDYTY